MRYRIDSPGPERTTLIFAMPERAVFAVILALASLSCLLAGLAYAVSPDNPGDLLRAASLAGVGVFLFSAIFLLSSTHIHPSRLIFDNGQGWLTVLDHRGKDAAALPFSAIAGFTVLRTVEGRMTRYSAGLDVKGGGRWELYASARESRAQSYRDALAAAVTLGATPKERPSVERELLPERLTGNRLRYSWRRRTRPGALALSLIAILGFDAGILGANPYGSGHFAFAIALGFAILLLAVTALGIARSLGQTVTVEVGHSAIDIQTGSFLVKPARRSVPLSQVARVDLSLTLTRATPRITLLQSAQVEEFTSYRQGTFTPGESMGMIPFLRGLWTIDVSALPTADRITLAEALRKAAAQASAENEPIR